MTPSLGSWVGAERHASATATVLAPGVGITSPTTVTSLPATVTASLTGYAAGQTVSFKLDSATGTTLTATLSPTSIPATGAVGLATGLLIGLLLWLGFVATVLLGTITHEHKPFGYFAINAGYRLVAMLAMGAILTLW